MHNSRHPDREKVRIDFSKVVLNAASERAQEEGISLSAYVERTLVGELGCEVEPRQGKTR